MKTTEIINGITVKIEKENWTADRFKKFDTLSDAVSHMSRNGILYGAYSISDCKHSLEIEQTEEAVNNWYENEMRLDGSSQTDLPTAMYK